MFRDDNKPVTIPGYGALYGGSLPAQIWRTFMATAMEGKPVVDFPPSSYERSWGGYSGYNDTGQTQSPGQDQAVAPTPTDSTGPSPDPSFTESPFPTDQPTDNSGGNGGGNGTGNGNGGGTGNGNGDVSSQPGPIPTLTTGPTGGP
jgi:membrane peptidoglycan carboxypeptidase